MQHYISQKLKAVVSQRYIYGSPLSNVLIISSLFCLYISFRLCFFILSFSFSNSLHLILIS